MAKEMPSQKITTCQDETCHPEPCCHPYHLETAQPHSTADVERQLEQAFAHLEQLADPASLSQRCRERLQKARRVVTDRLATVTFFIMTVTAKIEALDLAPAVESVILNQLIPAL